MAHPAKPYTGFLRIKRLVGVSIFPTVWDVNLLQSQHFIRFPRQCAVILLGGVKHCENKLFHPRTQHNIAIEQDRREVKYTGMNGELRARKGHEDEFFELHARFTLTLAHLKKIICQFPQ